MGNGGLSFQLGRGWGQSSGLGPLSLLGEALMKPLVGPVLQHMFHSLNTGNGVLPPG